MAELPAGKKLADLENDRAIKLMGTALATAIFLDATIVRLLLVPATMELLDDRNCWLPRSLDRLLPNVDVEAKPIRVTLRPAWNVPW